MSATPSSIPSGRGRPTVMPRKTEHIHHNCDNGHKWIALMYPSKHRTDRWQYVNFKQHFCPEPGCGLPQSEEFEIL